MWGNNANPVDDCLYEELIQFNSLGSHQPVAGAAPQIVYVGGVGRVLHDILQFGQHPLRHHLLQGDQLRAQHRYQLSQIVN